MGSDSESKSDLHSRISKYECLFNEDVQIEHYCRRLKEIRNTLQDELEVDQDCQQETIYKLNLFTWIEHRLDNVAKARELNQRVLKLTEQTNNITSLLNHAFLLREDGKNTEAEKCLNKVDLVKKGPNAKFQNMECKAELAYSYSRLGTAKYISKAIGIYKDIIDAFPNEFTWKYSLGLTHRRAVHGNISTSMPSRQPAAKHIEIAAKYLLDVALNCPEACLRGRAYSQLAVMMNYSEPFFGYDSRRIFREKTVLELIDEAVRHSPEDAWTLSETGFILSFYDLDKAIVQLEKSLGLKKHALTFHQLGKCYVRKANSLVKERTWKCSAPSQTMRFRATHNASWRNFGATFQKPKSLDVPISRNTHYRQNCGQHRKYSKQNDNASVNCNSNRQKRTNISHNNPHNKRLLTCPLKMLPLKMEDDYVTKAIDCFKESIQMSWENNYPAMYSLGLTLRACGKYQEATEAFNKIINRCRLESNHFITFICSFEQCGLCMMEMAKQEDMELSVEDKTKLFEKSEKNLLKAVSLAATLATKDPEIKNHTQNIWNSFRSLEEKYRLSDDSPEIIKKLIILLQRAGQYEKIPPVIKKLKSLNDSDIADPKVVEAALESYLALKDFESAMTFASMVTTTSVPLTESINLLILKTRLFTAELRLRSDLASAKLIFQPLFHSLVNSEQHGPRSDSSTTESISSDVSNAPESEEATLDVLILWDEKSPNQENIENKVRTLQRCLKDVFGLESSANLESCCLGGVAIELQIQEIMRTRFLLVILDEYSSRNRSFEFILNYIPNIFTYKSPRVLIGLTDTASTVPGLLKTYKTLLLENALFSLFEEECVSRVSKEIPDTDAQSSLPDVTSLPDNWSIKNGDALNSVLTLYCSMIGQEWPL